VPSEIRLREPAGGWPPPWPQARELAECEPDGWVLIGGLMVTLHARAAGLDPIRTTKDVDTLLDVAVTSVNRADDLLRGLGYRFLPSIDESAPAHRWVREADGAQVDILVPDHLARPPRFARRSTVAAPGATSVLTRHRTRAIIEGPRPVRLGLPTLAGAVVLKADAYGADSRDRTRHLDDLGLLLAAAADYRELLAQLSKSDRKRLRAVLHPLHAHLLTTPAIPARTRHLLPALAADLGLQPPLPTADGRASRPAPGRPGARRQLPPGTQPRRPRGMPTGGPFAPRGRAEQPDVDLGAPPRPHPVEGTDPPARST